MYYGSLCVEVTRRCNMNCAHCLRGDAENMDMNMEYLERFFQHVDGIQSITFTGGEPTMNLSAIKGILQICKERDIPVDSFYLVTNGKSVTDEFIHLMLDWTLYCQQWFPETVSEGLSGLTVSQDKFHEPIKEDALNKLRTLSVFREDDKSINWDAGYALYRLGRARSLSSSAYNFKTARRYDPEVSGNCVDSVITLTCTGHIIPDCDYEYSEETEIAIGKATSDAEMEKYLRYIKECAEECAA